MTWELHMGPRTWQIGPSGLVIGRASDCDVVIGDPSISRKHAVFQLTPLGAVSVEDPGSRHGTRVNGVRVEGVTVLKHADRIAISEHELVVLETQRLGRERAPTERLSAVAVNAELARSARPTRRDEPTGEVDPVGRLLATAEDALTRSDAEACARDLTTILNVVSLGERAGGADSALIRRFSICALRAAGGLGLGVWVDAVIDLHAIRPRVMHAATVDALEGALERLPEYDRMKLAKHVAQLRAPGRALGTYEQFCLDRLVKLVPPV